MCAARLTARDHIASLVDPGSYRPISEEGGHATIDDRPVTVGRSGSLFEWAYRLRNPYVAITSGRGAPLRGGPKNLGTLDPVNGMSAGPLFPPMLTRRRAVPVISAIVDNSFGDSSFFTGLADYVVQLQGTCLALTGPRVLAVGTGESVTMDELGGVSVHKANGQVDTVARSYEEVYQLVRHVLAYLPSNGGSPLPVLKSSAPYLDSKVDSVDSRFATLSGVELVVDRVFDAGSFFEIKKYYEPRIITGLARIEGIPVGVVANNPAVNNGLYTNEACVKAARHVCMCDAFGLPIVFLIDTPGMEAEPALRQSALARVMMLVQAVQQSKVTKCFVVTGRAFGPGLLITGAAQLATDAVLAWRGATIGYRSEDFVEEATDGGLCGVDAFIDPGDTRDALATHLLAVMGEHPVSVPGPLAAWPVAL